MLNQFLEHIAFSVQLFVNSHKSKLKYPLAHKVSNVYRKNTFKLKEKFPRLVQEIEIIKSSDEVIVIEDHGAGSKKMGARRKIADIYHNNCTKGNFAKLLFLLPELVGAKKVLEMGTSLGVSTYLLSKSSLNMDVVSLEGSESIYHNAQRRLACLEANNVLIQHTLFAPFLENQFDNSFDFVFVDGHHSGKATIEYCALIKEKMGDEMYLLLDDIRWSRDMYHAYCTIKAWPEVVESVDFLRMGLIHLKRSVE